MALAPVTGRYHEAALDRNLAEMRLCCDSAASHRFSDSNFKHPCGVIARPRPGDPVFQRWSIQAEGRGVLGPPVKPGDDIGENRRQHSRGMISPSFASSSPSKIRGRRECRVMASPMARLQKKMQAAVTTGSAGSTGIPRAMVLRLIRDLPGVRALIATVVERKLGFTQLDSSVGESGPHDFAVCLNSFVSAQSA
jgi:hypothetical protein